MTCSTVAGIDVGLRERRLGRVDREIGGGQVLERAAEGAERGALGADDPDFARQVLGHDQDLRTLRNVTPMTGLTLLGANMPSSYATILPATAEAATVSGDARYSWPGPERPW